MWIFSYYRLYCSFLAGALIYFLAFRHWWIWFITTAAVRTTWYFIERRIESNRINTLFEKHSYEFKQQLGPYGIRMINKAEKDLSIKRSLAEVFTDDKAKLKSAVEQLEMMDTLFKAGMRPDADSYQLHDLKLKYGKYRLEKKSRA